jgi:hypothetical protein
MTNPRSTSARKVTIVASACLVVSMVGSMLLQRAMDRSRPKAVVEDALYVTSPNMVKRMSLGFNGLMACIYWTRTVQYFGHRHLMREESYNELAPLLEITTALDPQLLVAYQFGANFLAPYPPNGAGEPDRTIQLMEYGIAHNPDNWRLYYNLGFVYYTELKDYRKAAEVFGRGSKVPNAHPFMKVLAARMLEHAGDFATARMLWSATYESSTEPDIRQNAIDHLRALKVDEDISNLEAALTHFSDRTKRPPLSMQELAAAEQMPGIPVDPDGHAYKLSADGRVLVEHPDDFPFITKGLPAGYKPPGRKVSSDN